MIGNRASLVGVVVLTATLSLTSCSSGQGEGQDSDHPHTAPTLNLDQIGVLSPMSSPEGSTPTNTGLQIALAQVLADPALGAAAQVEIVNVADGSVLYEQNGSTAATPASTNKLITAASVLTALGADHRVQTSVKFDAAGNLVLVGGGDPLLVSGKVTPGPNAPASLSALADQVKANLGGEITQTIKLGYDDSYFSGPTTSPTWPSSYVSSGIVAPITALMADGGFPGGSRVSDPSKGTAEAFAQLLRQRGIPVTGSVTPQVGVGNTIASVDSAPIATAVQHTLEVSDNTAAEVLAHLAGKKVSGDGSFEGGAKASFSVLQQLTIPTDSVALFDGSGLSRDDRVPPSTLALLMNAVGSNANPQLWAVAAGAPVAGFTGTLNDRFIGPAAQSGRGYVRAKTGTLTGVSSLSGLTVDRDGALLAFAFMTSNALDLAKAEVAWDNAAAVLTSCGCK